MPITAGFLLVAAIVQDSPSRVDSASAGKLTALPVVSYSEVTGVQYGGTAFYGFRVGSDPRTRPSSLSGSLSFTAKDHMKWYGQVDRWAEHNTWKVRVRAEQISYPLTFHGFGAQSPDSAEEWYSHAVTTVQWFTTHRWKDTPFFGHVGARYVKSRPREHDVDGLLATGIVPGSAGSSRLAMELGLIFDSRDRATSPQGGSWIRLIPSMVSGVARLTIDARYYDQVGSHHVVAFQAQYDGIAEELPFDLMPMIGADTAMRGYARGRFRDRHAFTTQGEFRSGYFRRVGVVAFAGAGTVAHVVDDIPGSTWYPTLGAGLRYLLSPREGTVARLDLASGRGTFGFSVGIGEAF